MANQPAAVQEKTDQGDAKDDGNGVAEEFDSILLSASVQKLTAFYEANAQQCALLNEIQPDVAMIAKQMKLFESRIPVEH